MEVTDTSAALTASPGAAPAPRHAIRVDFAREVYCILGVPVDAVDMDEAIERVRHAAFSDTRCMVSTPNLNFLVAALTDAAFRDSVVTSQLSLADGMPLVWVARLLGLPLRQRVTGSGLFERLCVHPGPPLGVYFFGGPDGAAEAACLRLDELGPGVRCAGFDSPGYVGVETMSGAARIEAINRSGAHFVVAALGAKKGQAWLLRNRARLRAPILCHLGAVVNFAAGSIRRAPPLLQRLGLEWLWRIVEEPALWKRYAGDGITFLRLLVTRVLPLMIGEAWLRLGESALASAQLRVDASRDECTMALSGAWTRHNLQPLREALAQAAATQSKLTLAMRGVTHVDSGFVGLLMICPPAFARGVSIVDPSRAVVRSLRRHGVAYLLAEPTDASPR